MFFKQLVRCPYLFESDELKLFLRPVTDVDKNLTLLPKLSSQRLLDRVINFYSIMGDMDNNTLTPVNAYVDEFA